MAERPKGYGMTAELQEKKKGKYDVSLAQSAVEWMESVVGEPTGCSDYESDTLKNNLKDGVYLCKLINVIQPGSVKKINQSKMAFKMMENIGNFLSSCEAFGLTKQDLCQTVDLYEGENMPQFVNAIHALGRKVNVKRSDIGGIGPKESDKNVREFDEETLEAGKKVIGLQMGTNRGASQAGSTPAGLGRQIHGVNLKGVN